MFTPAAGIAIIGSCVLVFTHVCSGEGAVFESRFRHKSIIIRTMLNELAKEIQRINDANGWGEQQHEFGTYLMLIVSELAEALEAHRKGRRAKEYDGSDGCFEKHGFSRSTSKILWKTRWQT